MWLHVDGYTFKLSSLLQWYAWLMTIYNYVCIRIYIYIYLYVTLDFWAFAQIILIEYHLRNWLWHSPNLFSMEKKHRWRNFSHSFHSVTQHRHHTSSWKTMTGVTLFYYGGHLGRMLRILRVMEGYWVEAGGSKVRKMEMQTVKEQFEVWRYCKRVLSYCFS